MENFNWKQAALQSLHDRNNRQTIPFLELVNDYSNLLDENFVLTDSITQCEHFILNMQHEAISSPDFNIQEALRALYGMMRQNSKLTLNISTPSFQLRKYLADLQKLTEDQREEIRVAKSTLNENYDKILKYEFDILRQKNDMELICNENESLKKILRANGLHH
jgi:hypothetical protein